MAIPITFPPLHHVAAAVALAALSATGAQAQGVVNALCSTDAPWCEAAAKEFTRKTGIKVNQAHKGTGEIAAQLGAEAKNLFKIFSGSHKYLAGMGCKARCAADSPCYRQAPQRRRPPGKALARRVGVKSGD